MITYGVCIYIYNHISIWYTVYMIAIYIIYVCVCVCICICICVCVCIYIYIYMHTYTFPKRYHTVFVVFTNIRNIIHCYFLGCSGISQKSRKYLYIIIYYIIIYYITGIFHITHIRDSVDSAKALGKWHGCLQLCRVHSPGPMLSQRDHSRLPHKRWV